MNWKLTDTFVATSSGPWKLSASLDQPARGWIAEPADGSRTEPLLTLCTSVPMSAIHDAYVCQEELVANYPQDLEGAGVVDGDFANVNERAGEEQGVSIEVRYRLSAMSQKMLALQATYALQTRMYASSPRIEIGLPGNAASEIDSIVVWQAGSWHWALIIAPQDVAQGRLVCSHGRTSLCWFGEFLERGVIRKCRLRLALSNQPIERAACEQQLQELIEQPLPLVS